MTRVRQYSGSQYGMGGGFMVSRVVDVATVGVQDEIVDPATPLSDWTSAATSVDTSITLPLVPTSIDSGEEATIGTSTEMACSQNFSVLGSINVLGVLYVG